jgi:hypothetical protein
MQRNSGVSQGRQCPDAVLRTFVTGSRPAFGGGGKPQRIMSSSRPSGVLRTTGAIMSGKMPGIERRLPERSLRAFASSRMACCPLVIE